MMMRRHPVVRREQVPKCGKTWLREITVQDRNLRAWQQWGLLPLRRWRKHRARGRLARSHSEQTGYSQQSQQASAHCYSSQGMGTLRTENSGFTGQLTRVVHQSAAGGCCGLDVIAPHRATAAWFAG